MVEKMKRDGEWRGKINIYFISYYDGTYKKSFFFLGSMIDLAEWIRSRNVPRKCTRDTKLIIYGSRKVEKVRKKGGKPRCVVSLST
jgi:hypothetical protein